MPPRRARPSLATLLAFGLAACHAEPVGQRCDLGAPAPSDTIVIASSSVDCESRLCLATTAGASNAAGRSTGLCTASCASDDDCAGTADSLCTAGFTCAPITSVGPFACEAVCVCRDAVEPAAEAACAEAARRADD